MLSATVKALIVVFLVSTHKTLPFAYFFRFYYHVFRRFFLTKYSYNANNKRNTFGFNSPKDCFKWVTLSSRVSPLEIDMYLHKSNSTYFLDLDIARTKLVTEVMQKLFWNYVDNVHGEFKGKGMANIPYAPIASVMCSFKRELKPLQAFDIKSQIFSWDSKWLFVLSKFVTKGDKLHAIAITKYVFKKNGRQTMKPIEMMQEIGLVDDEVLEQVKKNYELVKHLASSEDLERISHQL
ncbi:uncharacterized protein RJT20DRAFT_131779 [Scheffersomyces xylosifermentans]|uniref:uncharacterized protein n=1 Tax=Scheffersomyces xylosifermentans TaxID=1304137 RepID=UPI00315CFF6A